MMLSLNIVPTQRRLDAPRQRARGISRAWEALSLLWDVSHGALPGGGGAEAALFSTAIAAARLPPHPLPNAEQRRAALQALSGAAKLVAKLLAAAGGRDAAPLFAVQEPPLPAADQEPSSSNSSSSSSACLVSAIAAAASASPGAGNTDGSLRPARRTELLRDLIVAAGLAFGLRDRDGAFYRQGWRWGPDEPGSDDRDAALAAPLVGLALGVARALAVVAAEDEPRTRGCPYCGSATFATTTTTTTTTAAAAAAAARDSLAAVFRCRRARFALWSMCSSRDAAVPATPLVITLARAQKRAAAAERPFPEARRVTSDADSLAGSDEDRRIDSHASNARLVSGASARMAVMLMMASVAGGGGGQALHEAIAGHVRGALQEGGGDLPAGALGGLLGDPRRFAQAMVEAAANSPATAAGMVRNFGLRTGRPPRRGADGEQQDDAAAAAAQEDEQPQEGDRDGDDDNDDESMDGEEGGDEEARAHVAEARLDGMLDTSVFFAPEHEPTAAEARAVAGVCEGRELREVRPPPPPGHPFACFDPFLPTGEGVIITLGEEGLVRTMRPVIGVVAAEEVARALAGAAAPSSSSPAATTSPTTAAPMLIISLKSSLDKSKEADEEDQEEGENKGDSVPPASPLAPRHRWPGPPLAPSLSLATLSHHVARALAAGDRLDNLVATPLGEIWEIREDFDESLALIAAGKEVSVDALPPRHGPRNPRRKPRWREALFPAREALRQSVEASVVIAHGATRTVARSALTLARECSTPLVDALVNAKEAESYGPWLRREQGGEELALLCQHAFAMRAAALASLFRGRAPATGARQVAEHLLSRKLHLIARAIAAGARALRRRGWGFVAGGEEGEDEGEAMVTDGGSGGSGGAEEAGAARRALGAAFALFVLGDRLAPVAEGCPPLFPSFIAGAATAAAPGAGGGRGRRHGSTDEDSDDGDDDDEEDEVDEDDEEEQPGRGGPGLPAIFRALELGLEEGEKKPPPEQQQQQPEQEQQREQQQQAGPSAAAAAADADANDEAAAATTICALKSKEQSPAAAANPAPPEKPPVVLDLLCSAIADAALLLPEDPRSALLAPSPDDGATLPSALLKHGDDDEDDDGDAAARASNLSHSKRRAEDEEFARQAMRHPLEAGEADALANADALAAKVVAGALRRAERILRAGGDGGEDVVAAGAGGAGARSRKRSAEAMERDEDDDEDDDEGDDGAAAAAADLLRWSEDDDDGDNDDEQQDAVASETAANLRAATLATLGLGQACFFQQGSSAPAAAAAAAAAERRRRRLRAYSAVVVAPAARLLVTYCATPMFGPISCTRVCKSLSDRGALPAIAALLVTALWPREAEQQAATAAAAGASSSSPSSSVGTCGFFSAPQDLASLLRFVAAFDSPGPGLVALLSLLERAFAVGLSDGAGRPGAADAWVTPGGRRRRRNRHEMESGGEGEKKAPEAGPLSEADAADAALATLPIAIADLGGERTVLLALFHLLDRPPQDQAWSRHVQGACARVVSVLVRRHCEAAVLKAAAGAADAAGPSTSSSSSKPRLGPSSQAPSLRDAARWCAHALLLLKKMSNELLRVKMSRSLSAEALQSDVAESRAALARCLLSTVAAAAEARAAARAGPSAAASAPGL